MRAKSNAVGTKDVSEARHSEKSTAAASDVQSTIQTAASSDQAGDNQTQRDNSSSTQNTVPAPPVSTHIPTASFHPADAAGTLSAAAVHASGVAAPNPQTAATPTATAAQHLPPPAINTARLVQSIGQTEMRVGMRTEEFGNISIRTSATRDLISTQISVDHSELASALSTHIPEMQSRLGGSQPFSMQVDLTGGQHSGASGSMSNGTAADSQGSRQQPQSEPHNTYSSNNYVDVPTFRPAIAAAAVNSASTRLDIRA